MGLLATEHSERATRPFGSIRLLLILGVANKIPSRDPFERMGFSTLRIPLLSFDVVALYSEAGIPEAPLRLTPGDIARAGYYWRYAKSGPEDSFSFPKGWEIQHKTAASSFPFLSDIFDFECLKKFRRAPSTP